MTTRFRCSAVKCRRLFENSDATVHTDGNFSEAHGQRVYARVEFYACPFCGCAELDEIVVCRSCLAAEPIDGADDCQSCCDLQDADWAERIKRFRANAPDFERARAALVTRNEETAA